MKIQSKLKPTGNPLVRGGGVTNGNTLQVVGLIGLFRGSDTV